MKFVKKYFYCGLMPKSSFDELKEILLRKNDNDEVKVDTMIHHYRIFLVCRYSGYDIIPALELIEIQKDHRTVSDYDEFLERMKYEIDIDQLERYFGHLHIKGKQNLANLTIKQLGSFNLYLANKYNKPLKPIDVEYNKLPSILYLV
jgi:hypothetical protein